MAELKNGKHSEIDKTRFSNGTAAFFFDLIDPMFLNTFENEVKSTYQLFSQVKFTKVK